MASKHEFQVHVNSRNLGKLRELTENDCLLVSELDLMRGVDYRRKNVGIDLLIARDFPTTRSFHQGLGRVGRYSELC